MRHVPRSEDIDDYPDLLSWMKDLGLGAVDLQLLQMEASVQSEQERVARVEFELGWTMAYYEENVRCLIADPKAQQEMPQFLASLETRFPGPPLYIDWRPRDAFTRTDHV